MVDKPTHILVADDHPELIQEVLPAYGYQITVARDGRETLDMIQKHCQEYDLILLDIMMPYVNGWDILRHLREIPACRHVPVIMLTALESDVDQVSGLKIGADDYVSKPYKIPNLLARIEALLRRSRWQSQETPMTATNPMTPIVRGELAFEHKGNIQPLTERERDILALVAQGLSNREIAENLVLSELTVKTHLKNMFKKLNVSSRTQAILVGMSHHLIGSET